MNTALRTITAILITTIGFGSVAPSSASEQNRPAALTINNASVEQQEMLADAVVRFEQAGLELPPLVIDFSDTEDDCHGNAGYFTRNSDTDPSSADHIAMCSREQLILLHELAHAWDAHHGTEHAHADFLDRWGLERWNDHHDSWYERGTERAAHTIAFTLLLDGPTDDENVLRYVCGFETLTELAPPASAHANCA